MAWRWVALARELQFVRGDEAEPDPAAGWLRAPEHDNRAQINLGDECARAYARPRPPLWGYCGLAGQVSASGS